MFIKKHGNFYRRKPICVWKCNGLSALCLRRWAILWLTIGQFLLVENDKRTTKYYVQFIVVSSTEDHKWQNEIVNEVVMKLSVNPHSPMQDKVPCFMESCKTERIPSMGCCTNEPWHAKRCFWVCAPKENSDQDAHLPSLLSIVICPRNSLRFV